MAKKYLIVFTTVGKAEEAEKLAQLLVKKRAAACVSIIPRIKSIYHWQGNVETTEEWLLLIKTTSDNYGLVEQIIKNNHPYEVPELIALQVLKGESRYLNWLAENCHPGEEKK